MPFADLSEQVVGFEVQSFEENALSEIMRALRVVSAFLDFVQKHLNSPGPTHRASPGAWGVHNFPAAYKIHKLGHDPSRRG